MDFRALDKTEQQKLYNALRSSVDDGTAILMGRDTSFVRGDIMVIEDDDADVVNAIASVPCHY